MAGAVVAGATAWCASVRCADDSPGVCAGARGNQPMPRLRVVLCVWLPTAGRNCGGHRRVVVAAGSKRICVERAQVSSRKKACR